MLLWYLLSIKINNNLILPSFTEVFVYMLGQLNDLDFWSALFATIIRLTKSIVICLTISLSLGILIARFNFIKYLLQPLDVLLKTIPNITYIIVAIIWLGKESSSTLVVSLVVFPIMYQNIIYGFQIKNKEEQEVLKIYPEKFSVVLTKILFPELIPQLIIALKTSVSLGFKVCVMAEIFAFVNLGMGRLMYSARTNLDMTALFALSFWIIIIAYLFDLFFDKIFKLIINKY